MIKDQRYRPFYLPLAFVTLFFVFFILSQMLSFEHLFGLQSKDGLVEMLAFQTQLPFKLYGLSFLSSYFFHYNIFHLLINALIFFLISAQLCMRMSVLKVSALIFLTHFITLLFLIFMSSKPELFLGSSASTMGLLAYWSLLQRKYFLMSSAIIYFIYAFYTSDSLQSLGVIAHLLAIVVGILLYVGHRLSKRI